MHSHYNVESARKHFPALGPAQVYFDNAGGSQVLGEVIDSYDFPNLTH
jgi:selenocysteine lyase/cysteine desulfurase